MAPATPFNPVLIRPLPIRFDRPSVRTTFQFKGSIRAKADGYTDVFAASINLALKWIKSRVDEQFPNEAWHGASFNLSLHDEHVDCIAIPDEGIWSLRWTHPDKPFGDNAAVPGRTWINDIGLRRLDDSQLLIGVRGQCASRTYAVEGISLTRPKIIVIIANEFLLSETHEIHDTPWILNSEGDLEELERLLSNPQRTMPVYLLTQPDQSRLERRTAPFMLDHNLLARRTEGMAHVVALPWELGFKWTEKVGRTWSAYLGAVRTYMPELNFDENAPSLHPLALAERIQWFKYGDSPQIGESRFTEFLVDRAHQYAASKQMAWNEILFHTEARTRRAEITSRIASQVASENADWKTIYEEEIDALKRKNSELAHEIDEYAELASSTDREMKYYQGENHKLRAQIDALGMRLEDKTGESIDARLETPDCYDEIHDWIDTSFAGRLELHPRAVRGLKKADYEDVLLVCRCIQALAREYRNMRLGHPNSRESWDNKLNELGVEISNAITPSRAGEEGDTYLVNYPPHSSQKLILEQHLRRGNSRDSRRCLRIYFFWHEESQKVVIGWLPSHLDTRNT